MVNTTCEMVIFIYVVERVWWNGKKCTSIDILNDGD